MEARAIVRNVRMTPRKIKLICDLIRGKDAGEAFSTEDAQLMRTSKPSCASFSAIAAPMPREPPVTIAKLIVYSIL